MAKEKDAFVVFWKYFSRTLIAVSIAAALFIGFMIFALFYRGSTKPILSVADEFKPDSSWRLAQEQVEPPRLLCIGSMSCPGVSRTWERDTPMTKNELMSYLPDSWRSNAEAPKACKTTDEVMTCDIYVTDKGYLISMGSGRHDSGDKTFWVSIYVRRS